MNDDTPRGRGRASPLSAISSRHGSDHVSASAERGDVFTDAELLTLAELLAATYGLAAAPAGWMRYRECHERGIDAVAFRWVEPGKTTIAICFEGQTGEPADWIAMLRRRLGKLLPWGGHYVRNGLDFVRRIAADNPDAEVIVAGHSGGGGVAAWVAQLCGWLRGAAFGSGKLAMRTKDALKITGRNFVSVEIDGDPFGDSRLKRRAKKLACRVLRLPPPRDTGRPIRDRHLMPAYVAALKQRIAARAAT